MNKALNLYHLSRFAFTALTKEARTKRSQPKTESYKKDFGDTIQNVLKKNQLENFVLQLETKEVNPKDLATLTSFFRLWNKSVISKTPETKAAAIHEFLMMIASCDSKIKLETGVVTGILENVKHSSADYAFYQMSWPYPLPVIECTSSKILPVTKCALQSKGLTERYRFPRGYGIVTDLDTWTFLMYAANEPISRLKTYTYHLHLENGEKLESNLEEALKISYAFVRNALYEYRTLKNTFDPHKEEETEEPEHEEEANKALEH